VRRVAVTGLGIVSCIGSSATEVLAALRAGRSGITRNASQVEHGFKSQVAGDPGLDPAEVVDKRAMRFMGDGAAWCWIAMDQAIRDAGLESSDVSHERTGLVVGTGGPSTRAIVAAADVTREKGSPRRIGPFAVPKAMSSTASATLATDFKIKGLSFSISSACTTSLHCIGEASEMIRAGRQDVVFAGGGEELDWTLSALFDAMGAMSSRYNETPEKASRAFDADRDGFVIAGGAGILVLEELERAKARGATIHAEIVGYGATSDGADMVAPSGEGAARAMRLATAGLKGRRIDYINPHATSTPVGDVKEIEAIRDVFGDGSDQPLISATKSMTGHSLGGAGVQETIYSILMMQNGFVAPSINVETIDPAIAGANIATVRKDGVDLELVMSNSFGFGGTNGSLVLAKV
jgi:3-oxoacyl-[acyl-carrier-protein] synthase-1